MIGGDDSLPSTESTSSTTVSIPDPPASPADSHVETSEQLTDISPEVWDKTLTWENTLPQVNLLKSAGSEVFVRPSRSTNDISRKEPDQHTLRL